MLNCFTFKKKYKIETPLSGQCGDGSILTGGTLAQNLDQVP